MRLRINFPERPGISDVVKDMTYEEFCNEWIPLGENLLGTATGILGSRQDAEDALQDLYIKLWNQRDTLSSISNPAGYATTLLKNICIDHIRRTRPTTGIKEDLLLTESTDFKVEHSERIKAVAVAISRLPETQRRLIEMRVLQELSYEEISEKTGMSKLTLRVLVSRARSAIKKNVR